MKKRFLLFFFSALTVISNSQNKLNCLVLDSSTKQIIEFANVGIPNLGIGTVSNDKGEFSLTLPDSLIKRELRISMIGYQTKNFSIQDILNTKTLYLKPVNVGLNEVTIVPKNLKTKIVGNETKTKNVSAGFTTNYMGSELAVKLNIKHANTQLRKFFVNINSSDSVKPVFRFNVYKVAKKGGPGENILYQNIIINVKQMPSLIELDLLPYSIFVDEDVYISIEWIKAISKGNKVMFSAKLIGNQTYYKNASQDKWEKLPTVGIGLHAEIGY